MSTEEQAKSGFSLPEQERACRAAAGKLGDCPVLIFADEGVSGEILERPGLDQLRAAVRRGAVDALFIRDADRLSRKLSHQLLLAEEFERAGVAMHFLDFAWQDSPEGRLFFSIRSAVAEFEKEKIRDRTIRGKDQKARQGGIPVGFRVYGYRYDSLTKEVTVEEEEATVVRRIFAWFTGEDVGLNGIAQRLNNSGAPTKTRRAKWHRQTVRQILTQNAYIGFWFYGRKFHRGTGKNRPRHLRARPVPKPPDQWTAIPVPAIIRAADFEGAQQHLTQIRRRFAGRPRSFYLLSGLLVCSLCQGPMRGRLESCWGEKRRTYTCANTSAGASRQGCRPVRSLEANGLEEIIWRAVCAALGAGEIILEGQDDRSPLLEERAGILAALEKTERGLDNLLQLLASGTRDLDEALGKRLGEVQGRREGCLKRLAELEADLKRPSPPPEVFGQADLVKVDPQARKNVLRLLFRGIAVEREELVLQPWTAQH